MYESLVRFWTKIFALDFAVGVASGVVTEFWLGTNWVASYLRLVGESRRPSAVYALVRKFSRRGPATEAARACRDWTFEHLDCARVVSLVHTRNLRSCRMAERNGMRIVAEITRKDLPHHVYPITRAEWARRFQ